MQADKLQRCKFAVEIQLGMLAVNAECRLKYTFPRRYFCAFSEQVRHCKLRQRRRSMPATIEWFSAWYFHADVIHTVSLPVNRFCIKRQTGHSILRCRGRQLITPLHQLVGHGCPDRRSPSAPSGRPSWPAHCSLVIRMALGLEPWKGPTMPFSSISSTIRAARA